ncbi:MAG TPA: AsmA family protein [Rhodocyclaceae bacterium]
MLAVVALALLAVVLLAVSGNSLRRPIERIVQDKTGRALRIAGDLKIRPGWPLLRVRASGIAFANAEWAKQPPDMATIGEADFGVSLPQLLEGSVVVDELRLHDADVALQVDAQGRGNWELPGGPSKVELRRVAADDGRIAFDDPAHRTSVRATVKSTPDGMAFAAKGSYRGETVDAHGSGGAMLGVRDPGSPYPVEADADVGGVHGHAKGTVTGLQPVAALDLAAELKGESLAQLGRLLGASLPETAAYRSSGRIVHERDVWRYENFSTHIGGSDFTGTLALDTSGPRAAVGGEIRAGTADLADLGLKSGARKPGERLLPDTRIDPGHLRKAEADVKLSAQKLVLPRGIAADRLAAHVRLHDGVLSIDPLALGLAGGTVSGSIRLDGRGDPLRAKVKIRIAKVAVDRIVPGFAQPQLDPGRMDGAVDLAGTGDSPARLLGSADGSVAVLVNGGHVSRLVMEEVGLHLPRIAALKLGRDQPVGIRCAAADFKVDGGVMHTRTGVFDTTVTRVDAGGDIDLGNETLDLTLNPNTKEPALISLHTPIHIRGSFAKPDVSLEKGPVAAKTAGAAALAVANPLLALIPLIETGPGRDSDCGRLLAASAAAADTKKVPPKRAPGR